MNNLSKISALSDGNGEQASIKFGQYGNSSATGSGIELNGPTTCIYSDTIWLGKPGSSKTYINGTTQLNLFSGGINVQEVNGGAVISLEDYIAKKGGFNLIKIENNPTQAKVAQAAALSNSSNTVTVQAPTSLPSSLPSGSSTILALTSKDTGAASWYTIAQALGASYGNAGKILKCNAAQYSYSYEWIDIPKELPTIIKEDHIGKVLKINQQGNPYWGDDNNTTYTTATFASASHNHDSIYSKTGHTHSSAPNKIELSESDTTTLYPVVCNKGSPNTLYRYASTIGTVASSMRFKHSISGLQDSSILYQLKPVQFKYNHNFTINDNMRYGFIAEDVFKIAPELVELDIDDNSKCNGIYHNSILALAVAEIQKLRKELDDLKSNLNI